MPEASPDVPASKMLQMARRVLEIEAKAVIALSDRLDGQFESAVQAILTHAGRVMVVGVGKSGHIGRKLASTLSSTGTPAYFVHAAEASHGDLGMITREDVIIAISNSGETQELLSILPMIKRQGACLIAMTGNPASSLARQSEIHLDAGVAEEACPLNLAPTASTTAALALGDALAVALLDARGFGPEDFARSHPGGALGRRLLTHVRDVMRSGDALPVVTAQTSVEDTILAMTRGRMGLAIAVDPAGRLQGIFTDGDLRRLFERKSEIAALRMSDIMTRSPRTISPEDLAAEAVHLMEEHRITSLVVTETDGTLVGAVHLHDLFQARVI